MLSQDVDDVGVPVPSEFDGSGRVVPPEVKSANPRPMGRNMERRDKDLRICHRKDATGSENGDARNAGVSFVVEVAGDDAFPVFIGIVLRVVDGHADDGAVLALLVEEPAHDVRHALQGGEGQDDGPFGRVGPRPSFGVDVFGRLFVEPDPVDGIGLPLGTALVVGLEADGRGTTVDVLDDDGVDRIRHTGFAAGVEDSVARDVASAPGALGFGRAEQQALCALLGQVGTFRSSQGRDRLVEPTPLPPDRVAPGEVHGRLCRAGERVVRHDEVAQDISPVGVGDADAPRFVGLDIAEPDNEVVV